ncbi:hypothetical protein EXN66_Car022573 [Channa argus]|nr:hypothetical protein EXN66_Car022573 [Channa argus]
MREIKLIQLKLNNKKPNLRKKRSESKVQSDDQKNDLLKRKDLEQFPFRFLEVTVRTRGLFSESELQVYKEEEKLKQ